MSQDIQQYREPEATPVGHSGTRVVIQERPAWAISGWAGVLVVAACIAAAVLLAGSAWIIAPIVIGSLVATSLVIVQPGHTKVVRFFGSYVGTVRRTGLWWIVPLADRRNLSIRVRNFETNHLKVNDADGNPVEIAAIVVWQVADTSRAVYAVDDYVNFVRVQAESALRHVATTHPYDEPGRRRHIVARLGRRRRRGASPGGGPARDDRRGGDRRGADQSSGLLPGDRPGDAAPAASQRRRLGALHGSSKARWGWLRWPSPVSMSTASSSSTRNARQRW